MRAPRPPGDADAPRQANHPPRSAALADRRAQRPAAHDDEAQRLQCRLFSRASSTISSSLHTLRFLERKEGVVFLWPRGVATSHLAISLAVAAAKSGGRVYCATLAELITGLDNAQLFFQLISHRYENEPSLIASIKSFD